MPLVAPKLIESARVWVRPVLEGDLPALLAINGDEQVTKFLGHSKWKTMADAEAWFKRISAQQASGSAQEFVLVAKQTQSVIGRCGLFSFEEVNACAGIGYVLGRAHWRQGYMREALTALVDAAFHEMNLRRLEAQVEAQNTASAGLLRRLGFTREGVLRERWITHGETMDAEVYGLLRHEWSRPTRATEVANQALGRTAPAAHELRGALGARHFLRMTTNAFFFARATNRLFASEYTEWAISMLERDFDSRSLRILAGLDGSSLFEADDYFRRVLRELNIPEPDFETSVRAYACELATLLVAGALDPHNGVRQLYRLCLATNYAKDFMVWLYLDDALDDIQAGQYPWTYESLTTDNFEETVRTEAKNFLDAFCHEDVV